MAALNSVTAASCCGPEAGALFFAVVAFVSLSRAAWISACVPISVLLGIATAIHQRQHSVSANCALFKIRLPKTFEPLHPSVFRRGMESKGFGWQWVCGQYNWPFNLQFHDMLPWLDLCDFEQLDALHGSRFRWRCFLLALYFSPELDWI